MIKVIQWGTGVTGQHVVRALHRDPQFQIVGCFVTNGEKNGKDLGDICDIGKIGVVATTDKESIFNMPADVVIYQTLEEFGLDEPVDDICRLLRSGKNVVSTAATPLIYPKAAGPGYAEKIEAACREGGVSFHGTGIHPGFAADITAITLSGVLGKVDTLLVQEIFNYGPYDAPVAMRDLMGFGKPLPDTAAHGRPGMTDRPVEIPLDAPGGLAVPLLMIADALGARIERIEYQRENELASEAFDIAVGRVEVGTLAAMRYSLTAYIDGKPKLKIDHTTRTRADQRPDWPQGEGWYVTATGTPSMKLSLEVLSGDGDPNIQSTLAAAAHVINAIPMVCAASPGIHTLLDLPPVIGRGVFSEDRIFS